MVGVTSFPFDLQHVRDVHLVRLFIFARLFDHVFVDRIFEDDSIKFWQVDIVGFRIVS